VHWALTGAFDGGQSVGRRWLLLLLQLQLPRLSAASSHVVDLRRRSSTSLCRRRHVSGVDRRRAVVNARALCAR